MANKMEKASIPVEVEKEIVTELEQIFRIVDDKPYFELKYKKVGEDYYHVGYSSFDFHNVLKWEKEYFEFQRLGLAMMWLKITSKTEFAIG